MKTFNLYFTNRYVLKFVAVAASCAILITSLTGCSKNTAGNENLEKLSIVMDTQSIGYPLIVIAQEKGYFKEEGLDIEYQNLSTGAIDAVSVGKLEILPGGLIPSLTYASQKADLTIFGGTASGGNFIIAQPDQVEELKNIDNWKGRKLGVVRLSTSELVSRRALEDKGIDVVNDISYVEIDSYTNIIEGVRKGTIDVGFISSQYGQSAKDLGLGILFPMTDLAPDYVCCRQTGYKQSVETKRSAYVKLLQAEIRAYKDFTYDHEGTLKLLAESSGQTEDYVNDYVYSAKESGDRTFSPDPAINKIRDVYVTLEQWGYVDKGVSVEDFVDITIYQEALDSILAQYPDEPIYNELKEQFQKNNF